MFLRPTVLLNAASRATATRMATPALFSRMYATLPKEDVQTRVLDVVKSFDKVDGSKVTAEANFIKDLGLDSLDTVEVVMAIEEEFSVEIPDKDADAIHSVQQAIDYIVKRDDAH
ncbi:Acyl carrier protein, mitochondrial [Mucor flavus]|uniref:Acyl carrier protein n=1 Tax=Mucor flavus TaxID=439312 RepID=A0ABP9ZFD3_9FUNG